MSPARPEPCLNRLVEGLPRRDRNRIQAACEPVELVAGDVLYQRGRPIRQVYFPLTGFISLVAILQGHRPLELGLIGNEGMLGVTLVLDIDSAPAQAVVQGDGTALQLSVAQLRLEMRRSPALRRALNRYLYMTMAHLARTMACTHFHEIEPRLAHWLLMTHDRAQADQFHLTHELLADMLGVRRSGVTIAAGVLQQRKLISYTRGTISILDRKGLEAASCGCYKALLGDRAKLFAA